MAKINNEEYGELRHILENQYEQAFTIEDLKEIGDGLIDFFDLLIELDKATRS